MYTKRGTAINMGLRMAGGWAVAEAGDTFQPLNQTDDRAHGIPGVAGIAGVISPSLAAGTVRCRGNGPTPNR